MIELLKEIKERWEIEKPIYRDLGNEIKRHLLSELLKMGVYCRVTSREKDLASLLKKVIRKQYSNPYEEIIDKAGVRIVVHFPWQMDRVDENIYQSYNVLEKDDKSLALGTNELGYQAIHYLVEFKKDNCPKREFEGKFCEIQLRTLCQDVWSEMAHLLAYKTEIDIPTEILRQIHCLSALLEVGDKNFSQIDGMVRELPGSYSVSLLNKLEGHYYGLTGFIYDRDLSLAVIEHLKNLYTPREIEAFNDIITRFVTRNLIKFQKLFDLYSNELVFVSQPEIFMILERLEYDPYSLQDKWIRKFPPEELEEIAIAWGVPLG